MHISGHRTRLCVGWCMCVWERDTLQMSIILVHNYYHIFKVVFLGTYHFNSLLLVIVGSKLLYLMLKLKEPDVFFFFLKRTLLYLCCSRSIKWNTVQVWSLTRKGMWTIVTHYEKDGLYSANLSKRCLELKKTHPLKWKWLMARIVNPNLNILTTAANKKERGNISKWGNLTSRCKCLCWAQTISWALCKP